MEEYRNPTFSEQLNTKQDNGVSEKKERSQLKQLFVIIILLLVCLVVSTVGVLCAVLALNGNQEINESAGVKQHYTTEQNGRDGKLDVADGIALLMAENSKLQSRLNETDEELKYLRNLVLKSSEQTEVKVDLLQNFTREGLLSLWSSGTDLQSNLGQLQEQQQSTHSAIQNLTSYVEKYHYLNEKVVNCSHSYELNPYSKTCIRVIRQNKAWEDAKNYCEINGEYLATFETLESAFWFINLRKTNAIWKDGPVWIGGILNSGVWVWAGQRSIPINSVHWGKDQPGTDGPQECLINWKDDQYTYHDWECQNTAAFVCEKFS